MARRLEDIVDRISQLYKRKTLSSDAQRIFNVLQSLFEHYRSQKIELQNTQTRLETLESKYFLYHELYENAPVGYFVLSVKGLILEVNQHGCAMLGQDRRRLLNSTFARFVTDRDVSNYLRFKRLFCSIGGPKRIELGLKLHSQKDIAVLVEAAKLLGEGPESLPEGQASALCLIVVDVTKHKQLEEKLVQQAHFLSTLAHFDAVTQIHNRHYFEHQLNKICTAELASTGRARVVALIYIDLDNFKWINDSLGHDAGDKVLYILANRLQRSIRNEDVVARIGGDEFAILVYLEQDSLKPYLDHLIESISKKMKVDTMELYITVSIGAALYPKNGHSPKDLVRNADIALNLAKLKGKNQAQIFNSRMSKDSSRKITKITRLQHALDHNEFEVFYQPQFSSSTGELAAVETLMRWRGGAQGFTEPKDFIPIAKESGLIVPMTEWLISTVSNRLVGFFEESRLFFPVRFAINLPSSYPELKYFKDIFSALIQQHTWLQDCIELEFAEMALQDKQSSELEELLIDLKKMGIGLALDDFGLGDFCIARLSKIPISKIKIDRSFIHEIDSPVNSAPVVAAIVSLANQFGCQVVAEGVETAAELEAAKALGCHLIQGYYLGRPMAEESFMSLLRQHMSNKSAQLAL